ncbi:cartilage matrix protein [Aplysia californica]|uniref:Cartilage matrix protein n=1 Tax=Aplysia californica TaxID=6500 RepID=A0ABM0ZUY6_APLCA|nr:cartilage matrix protein [Aplysia californica]
MAITHGGVVKQETVTVCKQRPIELGIVLDSSSSISYKDFQKSIDFLQDFVSQYDIGDGRNDVRVSLITFGKGIYRQDAFDLTSYSTKDALMEAIAQVPHRVGLYTSTGEAIEYMSQTQLSMDVSRPWAKRISIVITDGNSQLWRQTRDASQAARDSGIDIYAVGVGRVRREELLRIAGDEKNKSSNTDRLPHFLAPILNKVCKLNLNDLSSAKPLSHTEMGLSL